MTCRFGSFPPPPLHQSNWKGWEWSSSPKLIQYQTGCVSLSVTASFGWHSTDHDVCYVVNCWSDAWYNQHSRPETRYNARRNNIQNIKNIEINSRHIRDIESARASADVSAIKFCVNFYLWILFWWFSTTSTWPAELKGMGVKSIDETNSVSSWWGREKDGVVWTWYECCWIMVELKIKWLNSTCWGNSRIDFFCFLGIGWQNFGILFFDLGFFFIVTNRIFQLL